MITLLTGIPGSGKSYWAVHHVSKLKDQSKILHNIEGFKIGTSLDDYSIHKNIPKLTLFKKSWHESNNDLQGWTIIIDEAAELFPKQFKDTDVISFFDYHRHYGIDIFLITQDQKKVCYDITCLAETHYRAASGASNPIPGFLCYQQMVGGEPVSRKWLPKKKSIFALYKSTNNHSSSTIQIGKIYAVVAIIGILAFGFGLKKWFSSFRPEQTQLKSSPLESSSKPLSLNSFPKNITQQNQNSLASTIGGIPFQLSHIKDYSGYYYVFAGSIYRKENFPFKVVKTRIGEAALLPPEIYHEVMQYEKSLDEKNNAPASTAPDEQATVSDRGAGGSASAAGVGRI